MLALLAFSAEAAPAQASGPRRHVPPGLGQYEDNRDERQPYLAWARGFLSGHNYANQRQQVTDVSSGTIALYAERFCRANPKASFADALYRMSDEFSGRGTALTK